MALKYKVGDRVRIKSLDWYNENKDEDCEIVCGEFVFLESMKKFCSETLTILEDADDGYLMCEDDPGYVWTDDMIEGLIECDNNMSNIDKLKRISTPAEENWFEIAEEWEREDKGMDKLMDLIEHYGLKHEVILPEGYIFKDENGNVINAQKIVLEKKTDKVMNENNTKVDMGEVSDGYHTFNELYEYRMLYNAALFNEFAKQGLYDVHKSRKHSDGKYPFGDSNWFIIMAELPTGQISNHYEMKDWDKFQIPEKPVANLWDEHSPKDVAERLTSFTTPKKEYPKTYEECCKVLGLNSEITDSELLFYYPLKCGDYTTIRLPEMEKFEKFIQLYLCRNAYWKIAGEEMGLGKPWEPDWKDEEGWIHCITTDCGEIYCNSYRGGNKTLAFPTPKMRNAFKENFDPDIEICKELL